MGTILSGINQGSVIAGGDATTATWVRVGLNYVVPFVVSNVGFCGAVLNQRRGERRASRG